METTDRLMKYQPELYKWLQIEAIKRDTNVIALVNEILQEYKAKTSVDLSNLV